MVVLRVSDPDFDVDAFLRDCPWNVTTVFRRGEPRTRSKTATKSGFNLPLGDADYSDLPGQLADAVAFLEASGAELQRLASFPGVTGVNLDFAIPQRDSPAQADTFPAPLVRLAGRYGLSLTLSRYAIAEHEAK